MLGQPYVVGKGDVVIDIERDSPLLAIRTTLSWYASVVSQSTPNALVYAGTGMNGLTHTGTQHQAVDDMHLDVLSSLMA